MSVGAAPAWFLAAAALLGGCGDPLLSASAYDSPLFSLHGYLNPFPVPELQSPRIAVVWVDPAQLRDDVPAPFDTSRQSVSDDGLFTLDFYAPPPDAAIRRFADPSSTKVATSFAFGELVLYEDMDGDGRFAVTSIASGSEIISPDVYRGVALDVVVVYVETPLPFTAIGMLPEFGPVLIGPVGYRLGGVACGNVPVINSYPPALTNIKVGVSGSRTSTIPVQRVCLNTRPIASPSPAP